MRLELIREGNTVCVDEVNNYDIGILKDMSKNGYTFKMDGKRIGIQKLCEVYDGSEE